jgi:nicotinamide mononucleotide transporter
MIKLLRGFRDDWTRFEQVWLLVFTAVNVYVFIVRQDTVVGLVTSLTGMMNVVLVAKGKISNYLFGVVNVTLYAYTAWGSAYYGEVMLNLGYFLPMQFVGLWLWSRNLGGEEHRGGTGAADEVVAVWLSRRQRALWLALSVAGIFLYGLVLARLGGKLPYVDSTSTVLSVIAMVLMVRRVAEQWVLWIVVNVVSVYMWAFVVSQGGHHESMVVMWSAYLVNAVYGMWNWARMAGPPAGEEEPAPPGMAGAAP